jgi:hypothetical protein
MSKSKAKLKKFSSEDGGCVATKGFIRGNKLLGSKREIAFKQVLRSLLVFFYYFSPKFQFQKSLRVFEYSLLKCSAYMTIKDVWGKTWIIR